jgi:hypothetical protein
MAKGLSVAAFDFLGGPPGPPARPALRRSGARVVRMKADQPISLPDLDRGKGAEG